MRPCAVLSAVFCLLLPSLAWISHANPGKQAQAERVDKLIQQLGNPMFAKREAARVELEGMGEPIVDALRRAAASATDLEVRDRAKHILAVVTPWARKTKIIGLDLVLIDSGEFVMGSAPGEASRRPDEPQHKVRITRPFYLGKYEVTQEEYQLVTKTNPSWFSASGSGSDKLGGQSARRFPVENVTWYDAVNFCNQLSKLDGYEPYYKLENTKHINDSIKSAQVTMAGGNGYRLPTEAEWEFACRAGTTTPFHFGEETKRGDANIKPLWVSSGYGTAPKWPETSRTTNVGVFPPNGWGLHDMHGNAAEWCWDWYETDFASSPPVDPRGPASGVQRVVRGGSWLVSESNCRSASRFFHAPEDCKYYTGFRVARTP